VSRDARAAAAEAAADAYPRIVATLIRVTGDWTLAEDSAQEALAGALERWPVDGVPANPGGWLMTAARNRALDVLRRATVERRKLAELAALAVTAAVGAIAASPAAAATTGGARRARAVGSATGQLRKGCPEPGRDCLEKKRRGKKFPLLSLC
jgi:DNA-directed RNA polymerase specialized sigma24 family protein